MDNRTFHDSSQDLLVPAMSRPVVPPPPPPPPQEPTRPRLIQSPELANVADVAPPPPPPVIASVPVAPKQVAAPVTLPPSLPRTVARQRKPGRVEIEDDGSVESRMKLIRLKRDQQWAWVRKIPGYAWLEQTYTRLTTKPADRGAEEQRKRELPGWLVSFIVHVTLFLVLALIPLAQMVTTKRELIVGEFNGEGAIQFAEAPSGSDISLDEVNLPMTNFAANLPELELTLPSISNSLSPAKASTDLGANLAGMSLEHGLSGRSGSMKGALLAKFGGNSDTEAAVAAGLKWLAYQQQSDGGWSLVKNYNDGAVNEDRTAATAMALNAFLGAGHTHKEGEYKDRVDRGLKFLLKRQDKEGFFANNEPSHNRMYSQAIATITVCEAYGMTHDSNLKVPASKALKFAEWSQGRQKGWRYEPREDSDLSVTGWYMMALMTGKMAGLEPSADVIKSVGDYLETVSHDYGARYSYQRPEPPSLSMTAEGLLCRQYLGWPADHPALLRAIQLDLLPNAPDAAANVHSVYYWYYATQVLHHVGGKYWTEWNNKMRKALPEMQVKKGAEAGSWDPDKDQFGPSGGRLYITCFNLYCLEVYYRHLALYDMK